MMPPLGLCFATIVYFYTGVCAQPVVDFVRCLSYLVCYIKLAMPLSQPWSYTSSTASFEHSYPITCALPYLLRLEPFCLASPLQLDILPVLANYDNMGVIKSSTYFAMKLLSCFCTIHWEIREGCSHYLRIPL